MLKPVREHLSEAVTDHMMVCYFNSLFNRNIIIVLCTCKQKYEYYFLCTTMITLTWRVSLSIPSSLPKSLHFERVSHMIRSKLFRVLVPVWVNKKKH